MGVQQSWLFQQLPEATKGYIAGALDSDGCLTIHRYHSPGYERWYYSLRVLFVNTWRPLPEWFESQLGGHIYMRKQSNPKWADSYHWVLEHNTQVKALLVEIAPYLIRKQEIAHLMLSFPESRQYARGDPAPRWIVDRQAELFEQVKALNAKGPKQVDAEE